MKNFFKLISKCISKSLFFIFHLLLNKIIKLSEDLLIIDIKKLERNFYGLNSDINKMIKKYPDKVFVIIDSERFREWEVEQAINMFNSLNADGLPLCDSDIISAQLYSAAKKQNKDEEYNKLWNELKIKINDLESKKILNIDSLLMQQMYYERAYKKEILTDSKTINVTPPGLRRYFIDINRDFANNPIESCTRMLKLAKMWLKIIEYPIVQVLFKFNENFKLFLAAYLLRFEIEELSEEKIYKVVKCFLRLFSIMELVDTGYSSSKFKTFLFKEQLKLIDSNVTEEEIENDFDEHIFKEWDKDELKKDIIEYEKNILIYLNEYLFAKEAQIKFDIDTKYDIEHIMPNSGNNLQIIRTDAGISDKNEFDKFVNKLGNKILLEYRINRSIGNEWFRTKVSTKITDKTGYKDSEFPIAQALVVKYQENYEKKYWTKDDIKIATEKAAERIVNFIFYNK